MEVLLLRQKVRERDQQIDKLREELEANRFDQKQPGGQALMRKCKALLTENRELGQEIREERIAELRVAYQAEQRLNEELREKCGEASEFCKELVNENDKLQGTISKVAGRLRDARNELQVLQKERAEAKAERRKLKAAKEAAAAAATPGSGEAAPVAAAAAQPEQPEQP